MNQPRFESRFNLSTISDNCQLPISNCFIYLRHNIHFVLIVTNNK